MNEQTNEHSKKMKNILQQRPTFLVRWGNTLLLILLLLLAAAWLAWT